MTKQKKDSVVETELTEDDKTEFSAESHLIVSKKAIDELQKFLLDQPAKFSMPVMNHLSASLLPYPESK